MTPSAEAWRSLELELACCGSSSLIVGEGSLVFGESVDGGGGSLLDIVMIGGGMRLVWGKETRMGIKVELSTFRD